MIFLSIYPTTNYSRLFINQSKFQNKNYNIWEIPLFLLIGVIGGCTGAFFNYLNAKMAEFRKKYVATPKQRLFECILIAACSAFVGFVTIFMVDDCQPVGVNPNQTEVNQVGLVVNFGEEEVSAVV